MNLLPMNVAPVKFPPSYQHEARERRRRKLISRSIVSVIGFMLAAAVIIGVLFFAQIFDVRAVTVHAPAAIPADAVEKAAWAVLNERRLGLRRASNIVLFSLKKIGPTLVHQFPRIAAVDVRRVSLHALDIVVVERSAAGLWCFPKWTLAGACYYYDTEGIAFSQVASSSGFLFVPVNDERDRSVEIGRPVAPDQWRERISQVKKLLQFGDIWMEQTIIPTDSYDEFDVLTREGWKILYSVDTDVRRQTESLFALLKEKIAPAERKNLEYVDLRIEDRIYYKMR